MASVVPLIMSVLSSPISIIPQPYLLEPKPGAFLLDRSVVVVAAPELSSEAAHLAGVVESALGTRPKVAAASKARAIRLSHGKAFQRLGSEGYSLRVSPEGIDLDAETPAGVFYGIQSLRQMLPLMKSESVSLPAVEIIDRPRFAWRGAHLDSGRHFMPKEFVLKFIDLIAMHKLNTLHFHLTEDQGWRVEIEKYPRLTQVGSQRKQTMAGHYSEHRYDGKPHGGFYTKNDLREIVAYAAARHLTVVPEIEMPGHVLAALAAYPELSCTGGPFEVGTRWGIYDDIYCAGNERVFEFNIDVLTEVLDIFPSPFIHIGGDEAPKARWKACVKCQQRIRDEGLKDEHELQSYFIRRIEKFLSSKGRRLVGWDEILEGGLAPGATVMAWRGTDGGIAAAKAGHDVVMAPGSHAYLDHYQSKDKTKEPVAIGGFTNLRKTYSFEPVPPALSADEAKHVLGSQGQLWSEYIPTPSHMEYMAFPRLSALAEVVWSPKESRNFDSFLERLKPLLERLGAMGVNYRKLDEQSISPD